MISFVVCGDPVAQPRHKVTIRGKKPIAYIPDDHPIYGYKEAVRLSARIAMAGKPPVAGTVLVTILFRFARPKSHTKAARADDNHRQKPDLDNLAKAVLDALNGVCWLDDSQVCQIRASKAWQTEGQTIIIIDLPERQEPPC